MSAADRIAPGEDIIDSRDIIERIEELQADIDARDAMFDDIEEWKALDEDDRPDSYAGDLAQMKRDYQDCKDTCQDNADEYAQLMTLADEASRAADWEHGEQLIHEDYFTDYIKDLVDDCYEMPKDFDSGAWPWRHMKMDWEAATDEAKQDYFTVEYDGHTYYIR